MRSHARALAVYGQKWCTGWVLTTKDANPYFSLADRSASAFFVGSELASLRGIVYHAPCIKSVEPVLVSCKAILYPHPTVPDKWQLDIGRKFQPVPKIIDGSGRSVSALRTQFTAVDFTHRTELLSRTVASTTRVATDGFAGVGPFRAIKV